MKKGNEDMVQKNIELSTEFSRYLLSIPKLNRCFREMRKSCLYRTSVSNSVPTMEARGEKVVYIRVGRLRPKTISRIESVAVGI